ncbi:shikimate kinase [Cryobacterium sp. SO2]|uniref:shikimate kinase n=1 Tax=Cryobacterium sp. SO2 TaxID=1897060 RepID=UPI0031F5A438
MLFLSPDASRPADGWPAAPARTPEPAPAVSPVTAELTRATDTPLYPLVFIGPMASGKSKIGRRVARTLRVPFIDTDKDIVAAHGPITEIFARHGEEHFRELERAAVAAALQRERAVVSLGGGAVLDPATRDDLRRATVVSLSTTADAVRNRTKNAKRPLLAAGPDAWQRIYDERRPLYEALASIHFDTSTRPVDAIAADIVKWVRKQS